MFSKALAVCLLSHRFQAQTYARNSLFVGWLVTCLFVRLFVLLTSPVPCCFFSAGRECGIMVVVEVELIEVAIVYQSIAIVYQQG